MHPTAVVSQVITERAAQQSSGISSDITHGVQSTSTVVSAVVLEHAANEQNVAIESTYASSTAGGTIACKHTPSQRGPAVLFAPEATSKPCRVTDEFRVLDRRNAAKDEEAASEGRGVSGKGAIADSRTPTFGQ